MNIPTIMAAILMTQMATGLAKPVQEGNWIRPAFETDSQPYWGIRDAIGVSLWPRIPVRGLIGIHAPYLGLPDGRVVNFVAIEPLVNGRRGYSEMERSRLDQRQGLRLWSADELNETPEVSVPHSPSKGVLSEDNGVQTLAFYVYVEPFGNGARPIIQVILRQDRPHEVTFRTYMAAESAPMDFCILTATMGNYGRLRRLWLKDEVVLSTDLWTDFPLENEGFAPSRQWHLDRLRTVDGEVLVAASPNESDLTNVEYHPSVQWWWKYHGTPATHYWRKSDPHQNPLVRVNGRTNYYGGRDARIPGGISYENFELAEPFSQGAELHFGVTTETPEAMGFGSTATQSDASKLETSDTAEQFVAAYVHMHRWFSATAELEVREKSIAKSLDLLKTTGIRIIMPYATKTSGVAEYATNIVPLRGDPSWDCLGAFVAQARKRDLKVYPTVCVLTAGTDEPNGILKIHPEWALRSAEGNPLGQISPAHPEAREWVLAMLEEIVTQYQPEGILLDYLRYPNNRRCRMDPLSEKEFEAEIRATTNALVSDSTESLLLDFKRRKLTELTAMISERLRTVRPGIHIAMYTWGPHVIANHPVAQDWHTWARLGYVDSVNVSGYCYPDNYGEKYLEVFEQRMAQAKAFMADANPSCEVTLCLGVRTSHGEVKSADDINTYMSIAKKHGYRGISFFSWSNLVKHLDDFQKNEYLKKFLE